MARRRALQLYYPWVVIGIGFLTVAVAFGLRNAFAVFLISVTEEFHWSRGLAAGALHGRFDRLDRGTPVIGILLDRYGPRPVLAGGALIMALGFVVSGLARSVAAFYLGMGVLVGIGFAALPMTSQATFLSNGFIEKRGMAIGLAASGIGLGIWLVVPATQWMITALGWRQAYFILAALLVLVVAPLNYFLQRQSPTEMNLKPDFGKVVVVAPSRTIVRNEGGLSLRAALATGRFWAFALGVLCGAIPLHMVLIHDGSLGFCPRHDRPFHRPGDDLYGRARRPARSGSVLYPGLSVPDGRHCPADGHWRLARVLGALHLSAVHCCRLFFPPVTLSDHRRRPISWQGLRRRDRRHLFIYRRRRGNRPLARRRDL
jgi:Major Facilitator Superfamily